MHISNLPFSLALAQSTILGFASPATTSPLITRSTYCANLPNTVAGAIPHHRDGDPNPDIPRPIHLNARASGLVWCLEGTAIYIIPTMDALPISPTLVPSIQALLENSTTTLLQHIEASGDLPVTSYIAHWPPNPASSPHNLVLVGQAVDVGMGKLTWKGLEGGFLAFWDFLQHQGFGYGQFRVFLGEGQVGRGALRQGR